LAFSAYGYALVLGNNVCSAANGVYLKKKLDSKQLGKYGLMYYNCLFMLPFMIQLIWVTGDLDLVIRFAHMREAGFLLSFLSSCFMGFLLMYSTVLCTMHNSALTTTIIGCLKNILVTFVGMYIGGDYVFSLTNFIGLNISMIASIVYSYVTFVQTPHPSPGKS
jgi:solute carrier family 35 protein